MYVSAWVYAGAGDTVLRGDCGGASPVRPGLARWPLLLDIRRDGKLVRASSGEKATTAAAAVVKGTGDIVWRGLPLPLPLSDGWRTAER